MQAKVYNQHAKEVGTLELKDFLFGLKWNADLVHQVMLAERSNQRQTTAKVKARGEVRGGGKKPWQQKGTGRARHGSIRSPLWRKGGVTHGPTTDKVFEKKINKKAGAKAIATVLSEKLKDHEVLFLDTLSFADHKTKQAVSLFTDFSKVKEFSKLGQKGGKTLIMAPQYDTNMIRATRNLKGISVKDARMVQVLDLLSYKFLMIPKGTIEVLEKRLGRK